MSKQVEPALAPVATEVKEQPVSTTAGEQSPVVDKELVAQLVGQAHGRDCPWRARTVCSGS